VLHACGWEFFQAGAIDLIVHEYADGAHATHCVHGFRPEPELAKVPVDASVRRRRAEELQIVGFGIEYGDGQSA